MPTSTSPPARALSTHHRSRRIIRLCTRRGLLRVATLGIVLTLLALIGWYMMFRMPDESYTGPLPTLNQTQRAAAQRLQNDVEQLAGDWPQRNVANPPQLHAAADWLESTLRDLDCDVQRIEYNVNNITCANIEAERLGTAQSDERITTAPPARRAPTTTVPGSPHCLNWPAAFPMPDQIERCASCVS